MRMTYINQRRSKCFDRALKEPGPCFWAMATRQGLLADLAKDLAQKIGTGIFVGFVWDSPLGFPLGFPQVSPRFP